MLSFFPVQCFSLLKLSNNNKKNCGFIKSFRRFKKIKIKLTIRKTSKGWDEQKTGAVPRGKLSFRNSEKKHKKFYFKNFTFEKIKTTIISKFCIVKKKTVNLKVRPSIRFWTPPPFQFCTCLLFRVRLRHF